MAKRSNDIFFTLLRAAVSGDPVDLYYYSKITTAEWQEVMAMAEKQGLTGVLFGTIERLPKQKMPPKLLLMKWFCQVEYIKTVYEEHRKVIAKLAKFYADNGIRMMVLKGYGLSLNYPQPNLRPAGDIDTYNFGQQKLADKLMHEKLGIEIDNSHHHHSVFIFPSTGSVQMKGVCIENHYDFISVHDHPSSKRLEIRLKALAVKECPTIDVLGQKVYVPNAILNLVFVAKHCAMHFSSTEMTLRQLLDWLLMVRASKTDWDALIKILKEEHLDEFVGCMNAIGTRYLGFNESMFPLLSHDTKLIDRIMNDILSPEFVEKEDGTLLSGLWVKPRRFWQNRWKHRLCYSDSFLTGFIFTLWAKILKPSHFRQ